MWRLIAGHQYLRDGVETSANWRNWSEEPPVPVDSDCPWQWSLMVNWNYLIWGPYLNRGDNGITNAVAHVEGKVARVCGARGDVAQALCFDVGNQLYNHEDVGWAGFDKMDVVGSIPAIYK